MIPLLNKTSKYKKYFKKSIKNIKFNNLRYGLIGIRLLESCRLTPKQLESIRRVFVRLTKRAGKFWICVFLNQTVTKKSKGSRMGKGVGALDSWIIDVKAGQVVLEFTLSDIALLDAFNAGIKGKIPCKWEFVIRELDFIIEDDTKRN